MANAILYYRTPASDAGTTPDPQNLPSAQILEFTFPDNILEGITETYSNNIKQIPVPNQDGNRKINIQENGLLDNEFTIHGLFKNEVSTDYATLKSFRKRVMFDTTHVYGIFGLEIDNAPEFSIDATSTRGLHIKNTRVGYAGQKKTRYDFSVTLGFGGTVP